MNKDHHMWRVWGKYLHRWGLHEVVASFLEALGPLTVVGAQLVYIGQPMLRTLIPNGHINALAHLLEDTRQMESFVDYLREAV